MRVKQISICISAVAVIFFLLVGFGKPVQKKWIAPASADKIINPLKNDPKAVVSGKKLFKMLCSVCHGPKGKGDGMAGAGLIPKPADLTSASFQSQTDGAIFWKIQEGRSPMPSYQSALPEKNRWEIINYIRTLKK